MHLYYCNAVLSVFAPKDNTIAPYSAIFPKRSALYLEEEKEEEDRRQTDGRKPVA